LKIGLSAVTPTVHSATSSGNHDHSGTGMEMRSGSQIAGHGSGFQ